MMRKLPFDGSRSRQNRITEDTQLASRKIVHNVSEYRLQAEVR
jgi:hypothetical protein